MAKKSNRPITKSANPEPKDKSSNDWIIWAAWADRITFEDIKKILIKQSLKSLR